MEKLGESAKKKGCTPGQLALAWLLAQGEDIIPIPGTKSVKYFEENWDALGVELTEEKEKEVKRAVDWVEVYGVGYPGGMMQRHFADTSELENEK